MAHGPNAIIVFMENVTRTLNEPGDGHRQSAANLLPLVYEELRRIANQKMRMETPGQTLSATGLVHEAFMRLAAGGDKPRWENRVHFYRAASEAMRRILIDRAKGKHALKRGGEFNRIDIAADALADQADFEQLIELDNALTNLERADPKVAELVKLRFFAGMTGNEAAEILEISERTADSWWAYARAYLAEQITPAEPDADD